MPIVNPDPLRYPGSAPTTGGTRTQGSASTTEASSWIQQQPWYKATLAKWGNPKTLTLGQRGYLARTAQQAGLNPDFGISTDGTVEDWSTPTASKIALAAFAAAAGGSAAGLFGGGSSAATPSLATTMNAGVNATAAPAVTGATGAGMSTGAGWFSPANIIPSAVQGIATIFGNAQQAGANREAAELQYKSTEEALADARKQREYEQAQFANYLGRLQPYMNLGTRAGSTLQNLLARSPYTKLANNGPVPQYSTAPRPVGAGQTPAAAASAPQGPGTQATVMLRAPNGSQRAVPSDQVDHWTKLGAVPV